MGAQKKYIEARDGQAHWGMMARNGQGRAFWVPPPPFVGISDTWNARLTLSSDLCWGKEKFFVACERRTMNHTYNTSARFPKGIGQNPFSKEYPETPRTFFKKAIFPFDVW